MKKLLAMVLAFVMVLSLVPIVSLGDGGSEGISSNTAYGDYKLSITYSNLELTESGSERKITRSFTVTNIGEAVKCKSKSNGNRIKFHIFNTNDKTLKEDFPDVTLPQKSENVDGNVKYSVVSVEKSGGGKIEIKTNDIYIYLKDDAVPDGEGNYTYFDKNETITLNLEYIIKPGDYDKTLVNFIGIYLPGIDEYNFGGAVGAEADGTAGSPVSAPGPAPVTGVTYHLNIPKDVDHSNIKDDDWKKDYLTADGENTNDFTKNVTDLTVLDLRDIEDFNYGSTTITGDFSDHDPDNKLTKYTQGILGTKENSYYFVGWATREIDNFTGSFTDVDYPVVFVNAPENKVGIRSIYPYRTSDTKYENPLLDPKYTVADGTELYAVWKKASNAGLMSYAMITENAYFESASDITDPYKTKKDDPSRTLKFNGYGKDSTWLKYVDLDGGHQDGEEYTITKDEPTYTKNTTNKQKVFAAWKVKEVNSGKNSNYIAVGGQTVKFYGAQGIFSLDAIWATTTAPEDQVVSYTGSAQTPKFEELTTTFEENNRVGDFTTDDKNGSRSKFITYIIEVSKDGTSVGGDATTVESKDLADTTKLPSVTEPGVYTYTVTAHYKVPDTTNSGATEVNSVNNIDRDLGTVSFTFTVVPTLTVNVTKVLDGRDWDSDTFSFNVTASNDATVTDSPVSVNNGTTPGTATVSFVKEDGTVVTSSTITISEDKSAGETGMTYAGDKTLSVTLTNDSDGRYTIACSDPTLTSNGIGNYFADVIMTNTLETGSLLISKDVPNIENDSTDFGFKVKFENWTKQPATLNTTGSATFTADTEGFAFTLRDGESVTIEDVPVGVSYTVTETAAANYIQLNTEQKGTITGAERITFTNYKTASLTVNKKVEDDGVTLPPTENGKEFNFTLSLSLPAGMPDQTIEGQTVQSGGTTDISFKLAADKTKELTGIPFGSTYSVKEKLEGTDEHFYTQAFTSDQGAIGETIDSESETITCTNTYHENALDTGRLRITKNAAGMASQTNFKVKVTYEYNGAPAHEKLYEKFKEDQKITSGDSQTYTIPRNGSILINNIPYGTEYTIEEVFDGGIAKPRNMLITVPDGEAREYEISGTGTDAKVSGAILEADKGTEGYDFDSVTLTNRYLGDLTIKKEVDGPYAPGTWKVELTLKFSGFDKNELGLLENAMRITDATGNRTAAGLMADFIDDDAVTVTLTNASREAVVYDVPIERTSYVISEDSEFAGDKVTIQVGGATEATEKEASQTDPTVFTDATANVVFTNTYTEEPPAPPNIYPPIENPTSTLTVTKRVDGEGADTEQEFDFTVKNSSGTEIASFKLKNGGTRSVSVTPGAEYTVTEEYISGYTPKWNGEVNGSVYTFTAKSGVNRAECVNTYKRPYTVPDILDADSHYAYAVGDISGLILPNNTITRKEIVAILFRLLKEDVRMENWSQESPFTDVPDDAWYSSAVGTLYNMGYLHGTGDGKFRPDRPMTRAEITALVASFFADSQADGELPFDDVDGDAWYADYIRTAFEIGLVEGNGDGTFEPDDTLTRAEAMTAFNKLLDRHPNKDALLEGMIEWPDNMDTSAWYYAQIQEATNSHTCGDKWTGEDGEIYERWDALTKNRDWRGIAWENVPNYEE